jgi:hypothetical protein
MPQERYHHDDAVEPTTYRLDLPAESEVSEDAHLENECQLRVAWDSRSDDVTIEFVFDDDVVRFEGVVDEEWKQELSSVASAHDTGEVSVDHMSFVLQSGNGTAKQTGHVLIDLDAASVTVTDSVMTVTGRVADLVQQ